MYSFELDRESGILISVLKGFFSLEEVDLYWDEMEGHIRRSKRLYGRFLNLCDATALTAQLKTAQSRGEERGAMLTAQPEDKAAFVVSSSLLRNQAKRIGASNQIRVFDSHEAARAWLKEPAGAAQSKLTAGS